MRIFRDELSLRRYKKFKKNKLAVISTWMLLLFVFLSFTAEFWANSKPIVLKFQNQIFIPILKDYHPSTFGATGDLVMDYRKLPLADGDWAVWPLVHWDPYERNTVVEEYPSPPSKDNLFGTDDGGRDVLTRLLYGLRYSLIYAAGVWVLSYIVGVIVGATMGYAGGWIDLAGMRFIEIIESVPQFLLLLTIISIFKPTLTFLIVFTVLFDWTTIAIYMRGEVLSVKRREFVEAATALGARPPRLIFKHILPNALTPIVVFSPFKIAANINYLAVLDYFGFGLQAPTPSWGDLLNQAQKYFTTAEWLVWAPSLALFISLVLFINIGLAARDAFDSKFG